MTLVVHVKGMSVHLTGAITVLRMWLNFVEWEDRKIRH
ncbi:Hypothetical protein CpCap5W_0764 [Corynebacterium pseudotuberculosis]|nr:Hypothetical protein Cp3995_1935 [Corynebacterium pseudotuberculosis 3/99-5]AIG06098.1 hypothetical protein CPTA_00269 [Corynebacterium pseudotuberculosis]AIG09317.1 hypothetical protein CPTB_01261 [Corynebacterium pseudotuberculosis]AIG11217.1 hypothetical protein CPTC_00929 [Corynebacterium pseudotuberculosis]AKC74648.1 Hypothetical protein Cp226_1958 [Corynebacterium pseudotuberculosis]